MIKKTIFTLLSLSVIGLSACSDDAPQFSEKLRKVGSSIEGKWQKADFDACRSDVKDKTIIISSEKIEKVNETVETPPSVIFANMEQLISSRYILLSGEMNITFIQGKRTLAYNDEGDKLAFAGFIVNGKLLSRRQLLEHYNSDGNAEKNIAELDFNFCNEIIEPSEQG